MGAPVLVVFLLVTGVSLGTGPWLVAGDSGMAHATYYGGSDASGTWSGNCGYAQVYPPNAISLPSAGYGLYVAAGSDALYKGGLGCGACYRVKCANSNFCTGKSIVVTITDLCPGGEWCGGKTHFDLSEPAFKEIAQQVAGHVDIEYTRVPCQQRTTGLVGGLKVTTKGSDYYLAVLIWNVGGMGTVSKVQAQDNTGNWVDLRHDWGAMWIFNGFIKASMGLNFRIGNEFGDSLTINGCGGQPSGSGVAYNCALNFGGDSGGGGGNGPAARKSTSVKSTKSKTGKKSNKSKPKKSGKPSKAKRKRLRALKRRLKKSKVSRS